MTKTRHRLWKPTLLVAMLATFLPGCHTAKPEIRERADREWTEQTKHGQSELTKNTGSAQQIDWGSLPTTPAK